MKTPRLALLPVVAVLAMVAALLTGTTASAATDPMLGAPTAGQCYSVSGYAAYSKLSLAADPVPCSSRHTLWIYEVGRVPESLDTADSHANYRAFSKVCTVRRQARLLGDMGRPLATSAYLTDFMFLPTPEEWQQGARWMSCEIGIAGGNGAKLAATTRRRPVETTAIRPGLEMCGTSQSAPIECSRPHRYHWTFTERVRDTTKAIAKAADRDCPKHVSDKGDWTSTTHGGPSRMTWLVCLSR